MYFFRIDIETFGNFSRGSMHVHLLGTCVGCLLLNILHLMGFEVLWTSLDMINSSTVLRRVGTCYV